MLIRAHTPRIPFEWLQCFGVSAKVAAAERARRYVQNGRVQMQASSVRQKDGYSLDGTGICHRTSILQEEQRARVYVTSSRDAETDSGSAQHA